HHHPDDVPDLRHPAGQRPSPCGGGRNPPPRPPSEAAPPPRPPPTAPDETPPRSPTPTLYPPQPATRAPPLPEAQHDLRNNAHKIESRRRRAAPRAARAAEAEPRVLLRSRT